MREAGWLVCFFWVPLVVMFWMSVRPACRGIAQRRLERSVTKSNGYERPFNLGFTWGLIAFSLHFIWLFELLRTKSNASIQLSIILYSIVVLYAALTSALWFWGTEKLICLTKTKKTISIVFILFVTGIFYFYLLNTYMFNFFGEEHGYPFSNPILPIIGFAIEKDGCMNCLVSTHKFMYLKPVQGRDSDEVAEQIYEQLKELNFKITKNETIIIVGPETTFPFALNKMPKYVKLWGKVMPIGSHLLFGSFLKRGGNYFQAIYYARASRIMQVFCKNHCVSFSERIPKFLRPFSWAKRIFLKNKSAFKKEKVAKEQRRCITDDELSITSVMCSELFLKSTTWLKDQSCESEIIVALVNDSWFTSYLKKLMLALATLKSKLVGLPILYVAHDQFYFL